MIDISEQSQKAYQWATKETLKKAKRDPILVWAESKKLNSVLQESVWGIRRAVKYIRSEVDFQSLDYATLDCPRGTGGTNTEKEPKEVRRYLIWSSGVLGRFGSPGLNMIVNCIIDGDECDWKLFSTAIRAY